MTSRSSKSSKSGPTRLKTSEKTKSVAKTPPSAARRKKNDAPRAASSGRHVGRPLGSGKYGEPTKAVRLPISVLGSLDSFIERKGYVVRLYSDQIQAGFPSPATEEAPYEPYDLGAMLIPHPASTFFIRVTGESMRDAGVFPGDILIVDRSLEADNGDVIVAAVNGEFTVKRLDCKGDSIRLLPENRRFRPIVVSKEDDFVVWGVVKTVIHNV